MATIRKLRGRWQAQVRRKGMKPRARSFDSKADAERWARELETVVDRFGCAPDTRIAEKGTLGDILLRYQQEVTPTKRGAQQESQRIDVLLRHDLAHRTVAGLSASDMASFRDQRLKRVSAATALRELAIVSHVIEVARREWGFHLPSNPVKAIRKPTVSNARTRRLTRDEEQRLLDACETGRTPCLKALIIVAIETVMRRGELLGLRWCDVDLDRQLAVLALTKNGTSREVPLSARAVAAIRPLMVDVEPDNRIFPLSTGSMEQTWMRLRTRAELKDLRFHDLRHEAVSRLFERGLNVIEVSSISGHKELRMLARYSHLRASDLAARLG